MSNSDTASSVPVRTTTTSASGGTAKDLLVLENPKRKYKDSSDVSTKSKNDRRVSVIDRNNSFFCLNFPETLSPKISKNNFISITKVNINNNLKALSCTAVSKVYQIKAFATADQSIKTFLHAPLVTFTNMLGSPDETRLTVSAKVHLLYQPRTGPGWKRVDVVLKGDHSQTATLKIWNEVVDEIPQIAQGMTITAENVVVNSYKGMKQLNSTLDTSITITDACDTERTMKTMIIGMSVEGPLIGLLTDQEEEYTAEKQLIPDELWNKIPVHVNLTALDGQITHIKILEHKIEE